MNVPLSVAQLQQDHVVLELECIDRLYLNAYVPKLTSEAGVAGFLRGYLGHRFASTKYAGEMTDRFVARIRDFLQQEDIELVRFRKGQRKDDVMQERLRRFKRQEGVVFVGVAQEKLRVPRTIRKHLGQGGTIPWIVYSTAMVNVYYFYCVDRDFGPFFLKFGSYFPYPAKLCLNGHEYLKRQLAQRGIAFAALDNGLLSCADLKSAQRMGDGLSAEKIDRFFRKWLARLPHPFSAADRRAGYRYDLSVLQAEFSLTQVWDRGASGRCFFEEVIRENLDLGRPEQVQLIFGRKLQRKTVARGRCRTRIITEGVTPSLHVYYKQTHLKQYHKEGRALAHRDDDQQHLRLWRRPPAQEPAGPAGDWVCRQSARAGGRTTHPRLPDRRAVLPTVTAAGPGRGPARRRTAFRTGTGASSLGHAGDLQPPTPRLSKPTTAALAGAELGRRESADHGRSDEL